MKTKNQPRKDWESFFEEMNKQNDDKLLMPDVFEDEDINDFFLID